MRADPNLSRESLGGMALSVVIAVIVFDQVVSRQLAAVQTAEPTRLCAGCGAIGVGDVLSLMLVAGIAVLALRLPYYLRGETHED